MSRLMLVEPSLEYMNDALDYIKECLASEGYCNGVGGLNRYIDDYIGWLEYLEYCRNYVKDEERVPSLEYLLVRESDRKIVGMCNIRLELNKRLEHIGGHIGASIRPDERRKGYNKINLYLALNVVKEHGIDVVYLDCYKWNLGSSKSMIALGGKLVREWDEPNEGICQRYEINVEESLRVNDSKYKNKVLI